MTITADRVLADSPTTVAQRQPRRHVDGLAGLLNGEWAQLRTGARENEALRRWGTSEPALHGMETLAELEARAGVLRSGADDGLLLSLLRIGAAGEELAYRVVLQLLLGKLVLMAYSQRDRLGSMDDAVAAVVQSAWETICTYPVERRTRKVRNNLTLMTLNRVVTANACPIPTRPLEECPEPLAPVGDLTPRQEMLDLLWWAQGCQVLSRAEVSLLAAYYRDGRPGTKDVAAKLGLTVSAVRKQVSRAVRKLAITATSFPDWPRNAV